MTSTSYQRDISAISQSNPCVVTTDTEHGYSTNAFVRITNVGLAWNQDFGMEGLENRRYKIKVLSTTTFSLHDPISGENIDSSNLPAYVSSGKVNLIRTFYELT